MKNNNKPFVFICHSHEEDDLQFKAFVDDLETKLKEEGIGCFVDHSSLEAGEIVDIEILDALSKSTIIFVIENEKMKNSNYCHLERGFAYAKGIKEVPYKYGAKNYRTNLVSFKDVQDFQNNPITKKGFEELLKIINEEHAKKSCENKQIKNKEESKIDLKIRFLLSLADKYYYKENYTVAKELYDEVIKLREETKKSRIESTV